MPQLEWNTVGDRVYESGLDKGVLYLPDGSAVPWNGLTAVIERFNREVSPVYYDGMKISEHVIIGEFAATMKALTYPDEFVEIEGLGVKRPGVFYGDQSPKTFGLCYRTQIGEEIEGDEVGYKIHIIYNLIAVPKEKSYGTVNASPSIMEFEWDITAIPEEVDGFHPTAHIVLDSRKIDPWLLEDLEAQLYGNMTNNAVLIAMPELVSMINNWYRVKITDHGDGTWSATSMRDGFISFTDSESTLFQIVQINAVYVDENTYIISDTTDASDVPRLKIIDNGDGTWTATTDNEDMIYMISADEFEIRNADAVYLDSGTYQITTTTDTE